MSNFVKGLTFGLILVLIGGLAFVAVNYHGRMNAMSEKLTDNKDKIGSLEQKNSLLQNRVDKLQSSNSKLAKQVGNLEKETASLKSDLRANSGEISELKSNQSNLTTRANQLEDGVGAVETEVNKIAETLTSFATLKELKAVKSSVADLEQRFQKSNIEGLRKNQSDLQNQVASLENRFKGLEVPEGAAGVPALKVGYVNAEEAFTVFTDAVSEERERAQKINEQVIALREKAIQGEVTEEEYKNQSITLQAEKLKAQLAIDLAMIEEMIDAQGFSAVSGRLKQLKSQVDPIMNELDSVLENLRSGYAIPEDEETLSQIKDQYEQMDDLLTRLIESKIFQVTNNQANQHGYDLVFRQENVILYRNGKIIDNLTGMAKEALKEDLKT